MLRSPPAHSARAQSPRKVVLRAFLKGGFTSERFGLHCAGRSLARPQLFIEEFRTLRNALPLFLRPVVTFGYYAGWRVTEVLNLQWRQVDLNLNATEVRLDPGTTKNGKGRVIYLDDELVDVMREQRAFVLSLQREREEIIPWVFVNPDTADAKPPAVCLPCLLKIGTKPGQSHPFLPKPLPLRVAN